VIRLDALWRTYTMGDHVLHALRDVSEVFEDGEHVAIIGPSGSGKSTLLNIIGCLDSPSRGRLLIDGDDVATLDDEALAEVRLRRIGFVFQAFHLVPRLSARENVELPMVFGGVPVAERHARAEHALEAVGLADRMRHRPNELSGGQKQRVAIARAIVMNPGLLLCDEPTGNLDSASGAQVLELLHDLNAQGRMLIVVTHDPAVARRADRVIVMRDGRVARRINGSAALDLSAVFDEEAPEPFSREDASAGEGGA
jgi:putative ABC transport system ATP-binding protein